MQGINDDAGDRACDSAGDDARDGRWLTYEELAALRHISRRAAVRMTQRHRLRRQPGNDGKMRILVSAELLSPTSRASQGDDLRPRAGDDARDMAFHSRALAALEEVVTGLQRRADEAEQRADAANRRVDATLALLSEADQRAARAEAQTADAQAQAYAAQDAVRAAEQAAREAHDAAEALRQAEEARKARGRIRRAWDGWRGR